MPAKKNETLAVATFEKIIATKDVGEPETIPVPSWGMSVRVRGLSRGEVRSCLDLDDPTIGYLHYGLVEPELTLEQAAELDSKSFHAVNVILGRIVELSGLGAGFRQGETG